MSANSSTIVLVASVMTQISYALNAFTIIIGTIGGIFNFITLTVPQLRRNSCVFYLLCTNVFQMLSLLIPVVIRTLTGYFGDNLERQSIVLCKFRYYAAFTIPELATLYMVLSIWDRCCATSSSAKIRACCQLRLAQYLSLATFIFGCISNSHILVYQEIYNNRCQTVSNNIYEIFFAFYSVLIISLIPHSLMLILCLITFLNLKKTKHRVRPTGTVGSNSLFKRFESQIITIIITQVLIGTVFVLLRVGSYSYTLVTRKDPNKSAYSLAAESLASNFGVIFYYLNFGISFYVSILTSKFFRETFGKRINDIYERCCCCIQHR